MKGPSAAVDHHRRRISSLTAVCVTAAVALGLTATTPASNGRGTGQAQKPTAIHTGGEAGDRPSFEEWLGEVRSEALSRGIRPEIVRQALDDVEQLDIVIERDREQPEATLSFDTYLKRRLTPPFVREARQVLGRHRTLLGRVAAAYGPSARIMVSVWGLESNFGRFSGVRPTIATLATLAYDPRRGPFFRGQLFDALEILNRGHIELSAMKGSWAGAMGQPQFMASTYLQYAVDFDGDGRRDIWRSLPDVFASIANYLHHHGWSGRQTWGREVRLPSRVGAIDAAAPLRTTGCSAARAMSEPLPLRRWQQLGVRTSAGGRLPSVKIDASLVRAGPRAFLVYGNYDALLAYNCSHHYALNVGLLADRLAAAPKARRTR